MPRTPRAQAGFNLIEVLIAMVVFSFAVMAFAGLQVRALGTTGDAHLRAQAVALAAELVERIRANPAQLAIYRTAANYDGAASPADAPAAWPAGRNCMEFASSDKDGCTAAAMARFDIDEVEYLAGQLLPAGRVQFAACDDAPGVDCVVIAWRGVDPATCDGNATPDCVMMQVNVQ